MIKARKGQGEQFVFSVHGQSVQVCIVRGWVRVRVRVGIRE